MSKLVTRDVNALIMLIVFLIAALIAFPNYVVNNVVRPLYEDVLLPLGYVFIAFIAIMFLIFLYFIYRTFYNDTYI